MYSNNSIKILTNFHRDYLCTPSLGRAAYQTATRTG